MLNKIICYFSLSICIVILQISMANIVFAVDFSNKLQIKISHKKTDGKILYDVMDGISGGVPLIVTKIRQDSFDSYCKDYAGDGFRMCIQEEIQSAMDSGNLITPVDGGYSKTAWINRLKGGECNAYNYSGTGSSYAGVTLSIAAGVVTLPVVDTLCNNVHNIACCKWWKDDEY